MKILVVGATGVLGRKIYEKASASHECVGTYFSKADSRFSHLDVSDEREVQSLVKWEKPDCIIYSGGMTSIGVCEKNQDAAWRANVDGTKNLANAGDAKIVFISSYYVFDKSKPCFDETDAPNPMNFYGKTKAAAESELLKLSQEPLILRLSKIYGYDARKPDFSVTTAQDLVNKRKVRSATNISSNPTLVDDIADVLMQLIERKSSGIYNICPNNFMSNYDFSLEIARTFGADESLVEPTKMPLYVPPRPMKIELSTKKIESEGHGLPDVKTSLKRFKGHFPVASL